MEDNMFVTFIKDAWRVMLDHPWITTGVLMLMVGIGWPLLVPYWIAVGIDRNKK